MDRGPGNDCNGTRVGHTVIATSRVAPGMELGSDPQTGIHPGGCTTCLGAITIDGNKVTRNPAWYIIAHASKYVRPGLFA